MDEKELITKLEGLKRPELSSATQQRQLKLYLVSARRSSRIGLFLVALPCLFFLGVFLKYGFHIGIPALDEVEETMAKLDHSFFRFVPPLVLVGGPLLALAWNLLAILHFQIDRSHRELHITMRLKWLNLLVGAACLGVLTLLFLYLVAENGLLSSPHPAK